MYALLFPVKILSVSSEQSLVTGIFYRLLSLGFPDVLKDHS